MIDAEGWLTSPLFVRIPGHPLKRYTEPNSGNGGLALHSIVGDESAAQDGIPDRFLSDEREPADPARFTAYAAASVKFILRKAGRGRHIQMSPTDVSDWTSGGREANTSTWSIEAEGGPVSNPSEPLDDHQLAGLFAIARAWEWKHDRALQDGITVRPHNAIARQYGYAPTACESNRYYAGRLAIASGRHHQEENMVDEAAIRNIAQEEAGRVFLPLVEQLLGLKPETFSDDATLKRVQAALDAGNVPGPRLDAIEGELANMREAWKQLADAAFSAYALTATEARPNG